MLLVHFNLRKEKARQMNKRITSAVVSAAIFAFAISSQGADATQTTISPGKGGFSLKWPNGNEIRLGAFAQSVGYFGLNDDEEAYSSQFLLRRARLDNRLKVGSHIEGRVHAEFAGTPKILDAYMQLNLFDPLAICFGQFKSPVSQERLQSAPHLLFDDFGFTVKLAPDRDIGIKASGTLLKNVFAYQIAVLNGAQDGSSSTEDIGDTKVLAGRLEIAPFAVMKESVFQTLKLGLGGSYGRKENQLLGSISTSGRTKVFSYESGVIDSGTVYRVAPGASIYTGRVTLIGEYVLSSHDIQNALGQRQQISNAAWDVSAGVAIFGGERTAKGFKVSSPIDLKSGSAGALEFVLRGQGIHIDDKAFNGFANKTNSVSSILSADVGLNWYLNDYARLLIAYSYSRFEDGSAAGNRLPEHILTITSNLTF